MPGEFPATAPQLPDVTFVREMQVPSPQEYVQTVAALDWLTACLLLVVGLVYMFYGWKVFRLLVVLNAAVLGVIGGSYVGALIDAPHAPAIGAAAGGVALAVLAWPLMKYAIGLMGGLAGGYLGYAYWGYIVAALGRGDLASHAWIGALAGLAVVGVLSFWLFRLIVTLFTSFQGATMAVSGVLALLLKFPALRESLEGPLIGSVHLLPLLITVPAVLAFAFQELASARKRRARKKAAETS